MGQTPVKSRPSDSLVDSLTSTFSMEGPRRPNPPHTFVPHYVLTDLNFETFPSTQSSRFPSKIRRWLISVETFYII